MYMSQLLSIFVDQPYIDHAPYSSGIPLLNGILMNYIVKDNQFSYTVLKNQSKFLIKRLFHISELLGAIRNLNIS